MLHGRHLYRKGNRRPIADTQNALAGRVYMPRNGRSIKLDKIRVPPLIVKGRTTLGMLGLMTVESERYSDFACTADSVPGAI